MEKLVAELKKLVTFKQEIDIADVVLIAAEDPQMLAFAIITNITRDPSRKDPWWHVRMQMLSVPLQSITWTLRMEQMCGLEIFTMGGDKRFMAPVLIDGKKPGDSGLVLPAEKKKNAKPKEGHQRLRIVKK